ncbi:FAD/NAD(P)-binding oxidoreductase family protein [Rhynchospora pubera]|uniref:FAD/NAD(P)-binding oxidoreductase family protein n=1 Tax=Rhynchospora pubera TaxID=906938 RepID=A0AAV8EVS0_9POAL|nr:FAD/NAD(P)-binding oxidoreductase family protein [Rhynchospora pubera]
MVTTTTTTTLLPRSISLLPIPNPKRTNLRLASPLCSSSKPSNNGASPPPNKNSTRSTKRRRGSYGGSRRSAIKKSFTQEQVTFTTPLSDDPVVGIIGGGVSGLVCAATLEERGLRSTVFDTGMHGLGGRMATRVIHPQPLLFDHAAQFFTCTDKRFQKLVDRWLDKGLVREWKGKIGQLEAGGKFTPILDPEPRYVGVNGMRFLADSILGQSKMIDVVRPCWISKIEPFNGMWHLSEKEQLHGQFDAIVIAHNGKCANRLLSSSGLPVLTRQMKRLELSAIWALLAAFNDPLPLQRNMDFEGAFVKGVESLSWMGNNSSKLQLKSGTPHCWTFFSTSAYGKRNKVPQENIPNATAEKVKEEMLQGAELALGLPKGGLQKPLYTRVQLWGAALPKNTPSVPCIFDPLGRAGICGDWLLGSSVESAALSGMAFANHIADYFENGGSNPNQFAIGLEETFQEVHGHDIGQFPGMNSQEVDVDESQMVLTS